MKNTNLWQVSFFYNNENFRLYPLACVMDRYEKKKSKVITHLKKRAHEYYSIKFIFFMNICKMLNIHQYNLDELLKKVMEYIYDVYKKLKKNYTQGCEGIIV